MVHNSSVDKLMSGLIGESSENAVEELYDSPEEQAPRRQRKRKYTPDKEFVSVQIDSITLQKIRKLSSIENLTLRSIVEVALRKLIASYEKENGELIIQDVKKKKGDASSIFGL